MHRLPAAVLLVLVLGLASAIPGFAQPSGALSYSLSSPPTSAPSTTTSFNATIGGVRGTMTMSPTTTSTSTSSTATSPPTTGSWTMTVAGKTFALGTYSCSSACSFQGTTLAGKSVSFSMTGRAGTISGAFATHGAWVSTVADWANHHLSGRARGNVVSQAAGGRGHDPSHAASHHSAQNAQAANQGSGHGAGSGNGGHGDGEHGGNGSGGNGGGEGHGR
jgi:hypothetical protein